MKRDRWHYAEFLSYKWMCAPISIPFHFVSLFYFIYNFGIFVTLKTESHEYDCKQWMELISYFCKFVQVISVVNWLFVWMQSKVNCINGKHSCAIWWSGNNLITIICQFHNSWIEIDRLCPVLNVFAFSSNYQCLIRSLVRCAQFLHGFMFFFANRKNLYITMHQRLVNSIRLIYSFHCNFFLLFSIHFGRLVHLVDDQNQFQMV